MPNAGNWRFRNPSSTTVAVLCMVILSCIAFSSRSSGSLPLAGVMHWNGESIDEDTKLMQQPTRNAIATILTTEDDVEFSDVEIPYLRAVRLLAFQLFQSPHTRLSDPNVPFLIIVSDNVPQAHRDLLRNDGATVIPMRSLERDRLPPSWNQWKDLLPKLYLWLINGFDRVLFLDADSVLLRPIDEIFSQPATATRKPRITSPYDPDDDPLPSTYMIAGTHDPWVERHLPPVPGKGAYELNNFMNTNFFVLRPSREIFDYYLSRLDGATRCDPAYPEQNLLNCIHRTDGQMPWQDLGSRWNQQKADKSDYEKGLRSIRHKWWRPLSDSFLQDQVEKALEEMEEYTQGHRK